MINKAILNSCCKEGFNESEVYYAYKLFFGTLVSEPRLKIINLLREGSKTVSEIVENFGADQTSVSHDLARLRACGFVEVEVDGKFRRYALNKATIKPLMDLIDKHMYGHCIHILKEMRGKQHEK